MFESFRTNPAASKTPADIMFPMEKSDPETDSVMGSMELRNPMVPMRHNKMTLNSVLVTNISTYVYTLLRMYMLNMLYVRMYMLHVWRICCTYDVYVCMYLLCVCMMMCIYDV